MTLKLLVPALELLGQLATPLWKWVAAVGATAIAFVLPEDLHKQMAIASAVFIGLDTSTGIAAAWMTGNKIESAKFGRVLAKIVAYGSVVIVSAVASKFVFIGSPLAEASQTGVLTLILATEGVSILENVQKMGFKFPGSELLEKALRGRMDPERKAEAEKANG